MMTKRELEVLTMVAAGDTDKVIGKKLGISHRTSEVHMRHVMEKLGANNRAHAVVLAAQMGIIDVSAYDSWLASALGHTHDTDNSMPDEAK